MKDWNTLKVYLRKLLNAHLSVLFTTVYFLGTKWRLMINDIVVSLKKKYYYNLFIKLLMKKYDVENKR